MTKAAIKQVGFGKQAAFTVPYIGFWATREQRGAAPRGAVALLRRRPEADVGHGEGGLLAEADLLDRRLRQRLVLGGREQPANRGTTSRSSRSRWSSITSASRLQRSDGAGRGGSGRRREPSIARRRPPSAGRGGGARRRAGRAPRPSRGARSPQGREEDRVLDAVVAEDLADVARPVAHERVHAVVVVGVQRARRPGDGVAGAADAAVDAGSQSCRSPSGRACVDVLACDMGDPSLTVAPAP